MTPCSNSDVYGRPAAFCRARNIGSSTGPIHIHGRNTDVKQVSEICAAPGRERSLSKRSAVRVAVALVYGAACHTAFAFAALSMFFGLFTGLTAAFGAVPWPWAAFVNVVLLAQFPIVHSFLLSSRGRAILNRLAPFGFGKTLATTTYALIASLQLIVLFTLWTPTGVVIWRADGAAFVFMTLAFVLSWALLGKATYDAGLQLQSGALGWIALLRNRVPVFPDMPESGLFKFVRQPIYLAFALILWTTPVWTVDQIFLAGAFTAYCFFAPMLKERRFLQLYGARFKAYRKRVPYWIPATRGPNQDV